MNESLQPSENEVGKKSGRFNKLINKDKLAFIPVLETEVRTPTKEQSEQVDAALANIGLYEIAKIKLLEKEYNLEHSHLDTIKEEEKKPDDVYFINITGAWGRGPEVEAEIKALACAMGKDGLELDAVSLPGHGETDNIPDGWNSENDFDFAADMVAAHIKEIKDREPDRKIVINAWSMGGVTALKLIAKYPELVDGVILIDTPVYPQNFKKLTLRFLLYEAQKIRSVKAEPAFDLKTKLPGLGIFLDRLRDRNKKNGIPLKDVLLKSAKSLSKIDLSKDGTLDKLEEVAKEKRIPINIIRGSNDFVIRHQQTTRLQNDLQSRGFDCELTQIEATGHTMIAEQPVLCGEKIRKWLESKGLVSSNIKE